MLGALHTAQGEPLLWILEAVPPLAEVDQDPLACPLWPEQLATLGPAALPRNISANDPPDWQSALASRYTEAAWVVEQIQRLHADGVALREICVVARTRTWLRAIESALQAAGLSVTVVSRDAAEDTRQSGVRIATMHRIKGLEFRHVFIVAVRDDVVPLRNALDGTSDAVERRRREINERALLHVAATRAVPTLTISWTGDASRFLDA